MVLHTGPPAVFTFSSRPLPLLTPLVFNPIPTAPSPASTAPPPAPTLLRKRPRSLFDDKPSSGARKKRRLRLTLITSRLSRPFSTPATHAVDKGHSKIAVWAKARRGPAAAAALRKEAILNRMRRRGGCGGVLGTSVGGLAVGARDVDGTEAGEAVFAAQHRAELDLERGFALPLGRARAASPDATRPAHPSPLGPTYYDALDEEEEWRDEDDEEEDYEYCPHPDVVGGFGAPAAAEPSRVQRGGGEVEFGVVHTRDPPPAAVDSMESSTGALSPNFGFPGVGQAFGMASNRNDERWIWC